MSAVTVEIPKGFFRTESRMVRGGNVTVLPDSRLVAQTMRLRVPAWACRNSCPYTLGHECSGSAAHSLWSSDSAVGTCLEIEE